MKTVQLLHLPVQEPNYPFYNNIFESYTCAILKSAAYQNNLLNCFDVKLQNQNISHAGDSYTIEQICNENPVCLGTTLCTWNTLRSIYIARSVKNFNKNILLIAGGPEIPAYDDYADLSDTFDILSIGYGEKTFTDVLKYLQKKKSLCDIKGIVYKKDLKTYRTESDRTYRPLKVSPILLDYYKGTESNIIYFTSLGCKNDCKYCTWKGHHIKLYNYPLKIIEKELFKLRKEGTENFHIFDSTLFTNRKRFIEICNIFNKINYDCKLSFRSFDRAENYSNISNAKLLKKCNFVNIQFGLQSLNIRTLKSINRNNHLQKWLKGINNIRELGISFTIDVMLGLPYDTLGGYSAMFDFLMNNNLINFSNLYITHIFPSSSLWRKKEIFGIVTQKKAPNMVLKTANLSFFDLQKTFNEFNRLKNIEYNAFPESIEIPLLFDKLFPDSMKKSNLQKKKFNNRTGIFPITKINIENYSNLNKNQSIISSKLSYYPLIVFKNNFMDNKKIIIDFIYYLSKNNPFNFWNIVFDTNNIFDLKIIDMIDKNIFYSPNYYDYSSIYLAEDTSKDYKRVSTKYYTILSFNKSYSFGFLKKIKNMTKLIWKIEITDPKQVCKIETRDADGILFIINNPKNDYNLLKDIFIAIYQSIFLKGKKVFFDNAFYQQCWAFFINFPEYVNNLEIVFDNTITYKENILHIYENLLSIDILNENSYKNNFK